MKKRHLLVFCILFCCGNCYAQLKEFTITPMEPPTQYPPIFRSYPEDGAIIIYSTVEGLIFESNTAGVDEVKLEEDKYIVFLKPETQILTVKKRGFIEGKLPAMYLRAKQVKYFRIDEKSTQEEIAISILSNVPGAMIFIDGKAVGTKSVQRVPCGVHKIAVESDGFRRVERNVIVSQDSVQFSFLLQKIKQTGVEILSVPEKADIFFNNSSSGKTTNTSMFLYPGAYRLKLIKPGYLEIDTLVAIPEDTTIRLAFQLKKSSGVVSFQLTPDDAEIFIDREKVLQRGNVELTPGRHKIEVQKAGYESYDEDVQVRIGDELYRSIKLKPITGTLMFAVHPLDAEVTLLRNTNPVRSWSGLKRFDSLLIGNYHLLVTKSGYASQTKPIIIEDGKTTTVEVTLETVFNAELAAKFHINNAVVEKGSLTIVNFERHGNTYEITYLLQTEIAKKRDIALYLQDNTIKNNKVLLTKVSGDYQSVSGDGLKKMIWDFEKEFPGGKNSKNLYLGVYEEINSSTWYYWVGGAVVAGAGAYLYLLKKSEEADNKSIPSPPGRPGN